MTGASPLECLISYPVHSWRGVLPLFCNAVVVFYYPNHMGFKVLIAITNNPIEHYADFADDIALLANTPNQTKSQLHSLELAAGGIGFHVNADKTENM